MFRIICFIPIILVTISFSKTCMAQANESFFIRAKTIHMNATSGTARYRGRVRIDRGKLSIKAERALAKYKNNILKFITAWGKPVTVKRRADDQGPLLHIQSRKLEYRSTDNTLTLTGSVITRRGRDEIHGDRLVYHIENKSFIVQGKSNGTPATATLWSGRADKFISSKEKK